MFVGQTNPIVKQTRKEVNYMKESEVKIITVMLEALPKMSDVQKAKLLGYGEAIVDLKEEMQKKAKEEKETTLENA